MAAPAKRACDACHRRKVRCNGANPCQNCTQASLACTFNKPPQKKGPKGSRAKVISELRKSQENGTNVPLNGDFSPASGPSSPLFPRQYDLLTSDLVESSISGFFKKLYPTLPIMNQSWVQQKAMEVNISVESYCLVGSLCAFMVIQPGAQILGPMSPSSQIPVFGPTPMQQQQSYGHRLIEDVKRVRGGIDYADNPSTASVITAFFLSAACFGLEKHTTAWFHLQEAILLARILRIHDEKSYSGEGTPVDTMNRRLFWILYISERAQALQKHRDLTFHETIAFPKPEDDPLETVAIPGLLCLFNLFRVVDDKVSEIWNNLRADSAIVWPPDTRMWLTQLQRQLTAAIPAGIKITESQEVDVIITQTWLRTVLWQLATASGCLSSSGPDESMTFTYPIQLAQEVVALTTRASAASMESHGIGLVEKLFDITYTLIDVVALVPLDTPTHSVGPRDHLAHLLYLIKTLRSGETRFASLLHAKICDSLPSLAVSLGLPTPTSSSSAPSQSGTSNTLDRVVKYEGSPPGSGTSSPYGSPPASVMGGPSQRFAIVPPPVLGSAPHSPVIGGLAMPTTSSPGDMGSAYPMHFAGGGGQGY